MIVCLYPKLSSDISFRMTDAKFGLEIFNVLSCLFLQFFVVSLIWVMYSGLERKVPENYFYFLVASLS